MKKCKNTGNKTVKGMIYKIKLNDATRLKPRHGYSLIRIIY